MGQPDLTTKELLQKRDVAADIINNLIYGGSLVVHEDDLELRPETAQIVKENAGLKGLTRDVCMEDRKDGTLYQIFGLESQMDDDYTMPVRVMSYDCASYERQIAEWQKKNREEGRDATVHKLWPDQKLKPVVTIVLYYGKIDTQMPVDLHGMLDLDETRVRRAVVPNYRMNLIELGKLSKEEINRFTSDFNCIAKYVRSAYNGDDGFETLMRDERVLIHPQETVRTLMAISKDKRYVRLLQSVKGETKMCELIDIVERRGMAKGRKEGENRFAELASILLEAGRTDELKLATKDSALRANLFREFGFEELVIEEDDDEWNE